MLQGIVSRRCCWAKRKDWERALLLASKGFASRRRIQYPWEYLCLVWNGWWPHKLHRVIRHLEHGAEWAEAVVIRCRPVGPKEVLHLALFLLLHFGVLIGMHGFPGVGQGRLLQTVGLRVTGYPVVVVAMVVRIVMWELCLVVLGAGVDKSVLLVWSMYEAC